MKNFSDLDKGLLARDIEEFEEDLYREDIPFGSPYDEQELAYEQAVLSHFEDKFKAGKRRNDTAKRRGKCYTHRRHAQSKRYFKRAARRMTRRDAFVPNGGGYKKVDSQFGLIYWN